MENTTIIVEPLDENTNVILLTIDPSLSTRQTLKALTYHINGQFKSFPTTKIENKTVKNLDQMIERLFGPGEGTSRLEYR